MHRSSSSADVDVVIPTWNRAERVVEAVRSVLEQTVAPRRVVVVDDGSTDDTAERLESIGDPRLRVLSTEHAGVSAARNRGIRETRGQGAAEWIAFLDSDDLWRPEKLERQLAAAEESARPLVHCDEIWIRDGRRVNPGRHHRKRGGRIYPDAVPRCCISPSAAMIRRDVLEAPPFHGAPFDETLPACEDYDLWLRFGARHRVAYLEEKLVVKHGGHDDQLSSTVPALDRFRIRALDRILREDAEHDLLDDEERRLTLRMLAKKVRVYGKGARKRGRHDEAQELDELVARWRERLASPSVRGLPRAARPFLESQPESHP